VPPDSLFPAASARLDVLAVRGADVPPTAAGVTHFGLFNATCDIAAAAATAVGPLRGDSDTASQAIGPASTTLLATLRPAAGGRSPAAASGYFLKLSGDAAANTDPVAWNVDALRGGGGGDIGNGSSWAQTAGTVYNRGWRRGRSGVRQWGRVVWEDLRPLQEPVVAVTWPMTHVINQARINAWRRPQAFFVLRYKSQ
jgi:hypothetical protein